MKKTILICCIGMLLAGLFAGCKKEEPVKEVNVPVADILQAVKDAYGDSYLPNMDLDAEMLGQMTGLDMEKVEEFAAQTPMISVHPDCVIIVKAKEGQGDTVEEVLNQYRDIRVNDTMMYPMNIAKTQASQVVRNGNYVAYLLVGAVGESEETDEAARLKFAEAETQKAIDAFNGCFE